MQYLDLNIYRILRFWLRTITYNIYYRLKFTLTRHEEFSRTRKLKGTMKGKCAFVFGNGPSLRLLDPQKIKSLQASGKFHIFAINSYINSAFAKAVIPDYYLLSDPGYYGKRDMTPELMERVEKDIDLLKANGIACFVPAQFFARTPFKKSYIYYDAENIFSDNISILKPRGYLSMTAYKALAAACFMGYDKIYICGFDNDYFLNLVVDENNEIYYIDKHFYDVKGEPEKRVKDVHSKNVGELLYFHHYLFTHLGKFKKFPIINLNTKGIVDCFTKHHTLDVYKDSH